MDIKKVAFLGIEGSYSYQTARHLFPDAEALGFPIFTDVVAAVNADNADCAVIPVENSITGRIPDVHRLMLSMQLQIVAEYMLRIEYSFIRPADEADQGIEGITTLYSHPQGFLQCQQFVEKHFPTIKKIEVTDNASAIKAITASDEKGLAAIGPNSAAELYNAVVVEPDIADQRDNYTRFLSLVKPEYAVPDPDADMTTMIFQVQHHPGALLEVLSIFEEEKINITKLETYTISQQTILPTFYVDLGAGVSTPNMRRAMTKLRDTVSYMKLLGSYTSSDTRLITSGFLPTADKDA